MDILIILTVGERNRVVATIEPVTAIPEIPLWWKPTLTKTTCIDHSADIMNIEMSWAFMLL